MKNVIKCCQRKEVICGYRYAGIETRNNYCEECYKQSSIIEIIIRIKFPIGGVGFFIKLKKIHRN